MARCNSASRTCSTPRRCPASDPAEPATEARFLEVWADKREIAGREQDVPVHLGSYMIGSVSGPAKHIVEQMLALTSSSRLSVEGYLVGDEPGSARIDIELPALA